MPKPSSAPSSPWVLYKWGNSGQYRAYDAAGVGSDLATFVVPKTGNNAAYSAFLTTTTINDHLGNLTGNTISATINLSVINTPDFVWGGLLSGWNTTGLPAHARLFISSSASAYSNPAYTACPSCYWWSGPGWAELSMSTGTATISDILDPARWSNANGVSGSTVPSEFAAAASDVRQIGLAFGGGSFYDVGIAILNVTGDSATFHLTNFLTD